MVRVKIISPTVSEFIRDVSKHKMVVIRDDGIYRHLRFTRPDTFCMQFDILTWPGYLCVTGDMHSWLFTRTQDMFTFFRQNGELSAALPINPDYWGEKLVASASNGRHASGATEYSADLFKEAVRERWAEHCRSNDVSFIKSEELWEELENCVLYRADDGEQLAHEAARDFDSCGMKLEDFWETTLHVYKHHFIWCCYAIVWGIQQYDAAREPKEAEKEVAA
jgi:hypothetical protein